MTQEMTRGCGSTGAVKSGEAQEPRKQRTPWAAPDADGPRRCNSGQPLVFEREAMNEAEQAQALWNGGVRVEWDNHGTTFKLYRSKIHDGWAVSDHECEVINKPGYHHAITDHEALCLLEHEERKEKP